MAKEMDWVISCDQGKVELLSKTEFAQNTKEWLFESSQDTEESAQNEISSQEQACRGNVKWSDFTQFFSHSVGGMCVVALIGFTHLLIHTTSVFVSIYLGLFLTDRFSAEATS